MAAGGFAGCSLGIRECFWLSPLPLTRLIDRTYRRNSFGHAADGLSIAAIASLPAEDAA